MSPEQLTLACSQTREAGAWEEFVRRFHPLIATVALRTARRWNENSPTVVDELVQETYLKLFAENSRLLREFKSRHPDAIYGYLKVLTANVAHDYLKASHAAKRGGGQAAESMELTELTAPETGNSCLSSEATVERSVLLQEIDSHLVRSVSPDELPRSRLIFWLYYRVGLSASAIAAYPRIGLTTKGVESVLLRLTRVLKEALARRSEPKKEQHEGLSTDEKGLGQSKSF